MITEIQYLEAVKIVNQYLLQQVPKPIIKKSKKSYKIKIVDLDISVRLFNCLLEKKITYLEELSDFTIHDLFWMRNFGHRTFEELKKIMDENKIPYNWEN